MPRVENDAERFNRPVDDVHGYRLQQQQDEEVNDFREHRHFRRHFVLVVSGWCRNIWNELAFGILKVITMTFFLFSHLSEPIFVSLCLAKTKTELSERLEFSKAFNNTDNDKLFRLITHETFKFDCVVSPMLTLRKYFAD